MRVVRAWGRRPRPPRHRSATRRSAPRSTRGCTRSCIRAIWRSASGSPASTPTAAASYYSKAISREQTDTKRFVFCMNVCTSISVLCVSAGVARRPAASVLRIRHRSEQTAATGAAAARAGGLPRGPRAISRAARHTGGRPRERRDRRRALRPGLEASARTGTVPYVPQIMR